MKTLYKTNNTYMKTLYKILLILISIQLLNCDMYAVIDNRQPIIITQQYSKIKYRCSYIYNGREYYMHIISNEQLKVGDTLIINNVNNK
jgi:hypothetical protein